VGRGARARPGGWGVSGHGERGGAGVGRRGAAVVAGFCAAVWRPRPGSPTCTAACPPFRLGLADRVSTTGRVVDHRVDIELTGLASVLMRRRCLCLASLGGLCARETGACLCVAPQAMRDKTANRQTCHCSERARCVRPRGGRDLGGLSGATHAGQRSATEQLRPLACPRVQPADLDGEMCKERGTRCKAIRLAQRIGP
jgi:hypothetical protein